MSRTLLMLARFALSAWVGAATMFVIIAIREVRSPAFDSVTRDELALLRFPPYYASGFIAVGVAAIAGLLLCVCVRRPAVYSAFALTLLSLGLMTYDYQRIYRPLARMVSPPGQPRPAEFRQLHRQSEVINSLQVGCALAAALTLCACDPQRVRAD